MKKLFKIIFSRMTIVIIAILLQLGISILLPYIINHFYPIVFNHYYIQIDLVINLIGIILLIHIINKDN